MRSIDIAGEHSELGGSIYHKENKLFHDLVTLGKFQTFDPIHGHTDPEAKPPRNFTPETHLLGVWDGNDFLFQESESNIANIFNGLWRYGLDGKYVSGEANRVLHKFLKIYELLEQQTFSSVEEVLDAMDLRPLTGLSLHDYLFSGGYCGYNNGSYCHEIVTGLTRVNYGQSMDLNALVGLIALIGSTDDILGVVGGNYKVMEYAIWHSNALLHLNSPVTSIIKECKEDLCFYNIAYKHGAEERLAKRFDKVIIATPLEFASIEMVGFDLPKQGMQKRPYQLTHVTMVVGELNLEGYFGLPKGATQPQMIVTSEDPRSEFTSIFLHSDYNRHGEIRKLYKVFSREHLSEAKLDDIFTKRSTTHQTEFYAYPVLDPLPSGVPFPPIIIEGNVFYVNAMESAFSTIETEMISGKNIARLVSKSLQT